MFNSNEPCVLYKMEVVTWICAQNKDTIVGSIVKFIQLVTGVNNNM